MSAFFQKDEYSKFVKRPLLTGCCDFETSPCCDDPLPPVGCQIVYNLFLFVVDVNTNVIRMHSVVYSSYSNADLNLNINIASFIANLGIVLTRTENLVIYDSIWSTTDPLTISNFNVYNNTLTLVSTYDISGSVPITQPALNQQNNFNIYLEDISQPGFVYDYDITTDCRNVSVILQF